MARPIGTAAFVLGFTVLAACDNPFPPGATVIGTFGGNNAALMADDTSAHVHIGCTYGDVHEPIVLDVSSRFDVAGEHNITAYPVDLGIFHPARFTGSISGRIMTLRVMLTDTTVTLGPVTVKLDEEPAMGSCPKCFGRGARARPAR